MVTPDRARNRHVAAIAVGVSFAMLGLAYASVPLYRKFCQVTGFGGTTQRAEQAPAKTTGHQVTVRFDANVSAGLGWNFHAVQPLMAVRAGEQQMAHYRATNLTGRPLTGSAVFNVTPESAGAYFNKIQCFCFTEQRLGPGESIDMPVVFFVDPDIAEDPDTKSITEITLSYTFYPVDQPTKLSAAPAAAAAIAN